MELICLLGRISVEMGILLINFCTKPIQTTAALCGYTLFMSLEFRRGVEDDDNNDFRTPNFEVVLLQPRFSVDFLIKKPRSSKYALNTSDTLGY